MAEWVVKKTAPRPATSGVAGLDDELTKVLNALEVEHPGFELGQIVPVLSKPTHSGGAEALAFLITARVHSRGMQPA